MCGLMSDALTLTLLESMGDRRYLAEDGLVQRRDPRPAPDLELGRRDVEVRAAVDDPVAPVLAGRVDGADLQVLGEKGFPTHPFSKDKESRREQPLGYKRWAGRRSKLGKGQLAYKRRGSRPPSRDPSRG